MNNLCCKINPNCICEACGMAVCYECFKVGSGPGGVNKEYVARVSYHEQGGQCPEGANTWINAEDKDDPTIIFGKKECKT